MEKPLLEKLSWIAAIISAFVAIMIWIDSDTQEKKPAQFPSAALELTDHKEGAPSVIEKHFESELSKTGALVWSRLFPSELEGENDAPVDLAVDSEGSILVLSKTWKPGLIDLLQESKNARLHKIDANGEILWEVELGFPESEDTPVGIVSDGEGGAFVLCKSRIRVDDVSQIRGLLFRIDNNGKEIWFRHVGGDDNRIRFIKKHYDNGVLVSGWAWFEDDNVSGGWIAAYSKDGYRLWDRDYVHKKNEDDAFVSFGDLVTLSSGITYGLYHNNGLGNGGLYWGQTYVVTIDKDGNHLSTLPVGPGHIESKNALNIPKQILLTNDNGILISLSERDYSTDNSSEYSDYTRFIKLNKELKVVWSKKGNEIKFPNQEIAISNDGDMVGVGIVSTVIKEQSKEDKARFGRRERNHDAVLTKLNSNAEVIWSRRVSGLGQDQFRKIEILQRGDFLVLGATNSLNAKGHTWLLKTDDNFNIPSLEWVELGQ